MSAIKMQTRFHYVGFITFYDRRVRKSRAGLTFESLDNVVKRRPQNSSTFDKAKRPKSHLESSYCGKAKHELFIPF